MTVFLITGANRGLGLETTKQLFAKLPKATIIMGARDVATLAAHVDGFKAAGFAASAVQLDVTDAASIAAAVEAVQTQFGKLDVLINNAGVADWATAQDITAETLQRVFSINVFGSMLCAREAIKRLSTRHGGAGGSIVNLSSVAATLGSPGLYVDYAASKGAIDSFTIGLARELATEGVRVNGVRPGIIDTEIHASGGMADRAQQSLAMIPMRRAGRADEVAAAIGWLLSDEASYTTGAIIDVSGGR